MAGPIFVVGGMRSGTTLLRLMLDSHPAISVGSETGFMGAAAAVKKIPGWRNGAEWYGRIGWSEDELDERLREFFGGMFQRHAQQQGKVRWGEKTPFHTMHMPAMAEIFPDAVFIGLVRHPGGAVASLKQSFHYSVDAAARYWTETNATMTKCGADLGDRFVLCRYEDLVATPEPVTRALMSWLDEEWTPALVEHHKAQRERKAPRLVDGGTVAHDAIDPKRAERWLDQLTAEDLTVLNDVCGSLAAVYGYDIASPQPAVGPLCSSSGCLAGLRNQPDPKPRRVEGRRGAAAARVRHSAGRHRRRHGGACVQGGGGAVEAAHSSRRQIERQPQTCGPRPLLHRPPRGRQRAGQPVLVPGALLALSAVTATGLTA